MNVGLKAVETCTGCGACAVICPKNAIEMVENEKGFPYSCVNSSLCNDCGLCMKKCPQEKDVCENTPTIYALKHKSETVRSESTSGGAFTALSDVVLHNGGTVYGAVFDDGFSVKHVRAENAEIRNRMRGSKYVKSNIDSDIYKSVKKDLSEGKEVLFSGTPCQIAGLYSFLGKDYDNLITLDFVCHGTPSNKYWLSYLKDVERKNRKKVADVYFRSKADGWHHTKSVFKDRKGKAFPTIYSKAYMNVFQNLNLHSPACFECKYCSYNRISDITMGDFWGIEKSMPEIDDDKGISLLLVNTEKGETVFNKILNDSVVYRSTAEACSQAHLLYPPQKPDDYDSFWEQLFREKGTFKTVLKFSKITYKERIKDRIRPVLKKTGILNFLKRYR